MGWMKSAFAFLLLLAFSWFAGGCQEPPADVSSPKTYRANAITFDYPGNWRVTEDSTISGYFFVETPGDALVTFISLPRDQAPELADYAKDHSSATRDATPVGNISSEGLTELPAVDGYQWMHERLNISLLGENVPHQRFYAMRDIGEKRIILVFQVATEDLSRAKPGFDLIKDTLQAD